ncbi:hypothetical protein BDP27DRAFT_1402929 [Rhodocollybia butyracea]|uniref:Uncharacterized protein n=1 Tax=Rhodocollybia butyracea TaxID=206335 RepID=A0A9P5U6N4_9AGAR|nr:hypothetical protein BDP27DRAFT_1402929 [Rhodocollybia butyracea]
MFTFQPLGWFGVLQLGVARTMPNLNTVSPDKDFYFDLGKTFLAIVTFWVSKLFSSHINSILFPPHALLELHANAYSQAPLTTQSLTLHNASTNQFLPPKYRPITGYQRLSLEHGLEIDSDSSPPSEDTAAADIAALVADDTDEDIYEEEKENFDPLTTDQISDVKSPTKPAETVPEKRPVFGILHGPEYGVDIPPVAHPSYAPPSETCYYSSPQWDDTSDESYYNSNASGFSSAYDYDIGSDSSDW